MTDEQQLQRWREALAEEPVSGDASPHPGYCEEAPSWSWRTLVENLAPMSDRVLELGAGGGEGYAHDTVASVVPGVSLPVPEASFDLVVSRQEAFEAAEIARVLMPDGAFLTEQVGGEDSREIREVFGMEAPASEVTLESTVHQLGAAGLRVDRSDSFHGHCEFDDVPGLLRYLRRAPWNAPEDLDVDRHRAALEQLQARMRNGPFTATVSRFVVLARAPEAPDVGRTDFAGLTGDALDVPRV